MLTTEIKLPMHDSPPVSVPDILLQHHWSHLDDLAEQRVDVSLQVSDLLALGLDSRPLSHQQLDQVLAASMSTAASEPNSYLSGFPIEFAQNLQWQLFVCRGLCI